MINRKAKLKETLVEECEKYVEPNPKKEPTAFIDHVLVPMGDAYREVKTASFQATALASEVNGVLKWLNRIDNFDWVPPAVLYLSQHRNTPDKVLEFLRGLERLATGLMILRADVNERVNRFGSLLTSVEKNGSFKPDDESLQLTSTEKQNILKTLDGDLYFEKKTRLLIL